MAQDDPKVVTEATLGAATDTKPVAAPSFSAAAKATAEKETERLKALAGVTEPEKPPEKPVEKPADAPFNFDDWVKAQPKEALDRASQIVAENYNKQLKDRFGDDLYGVLEEAATDEGLRTKLARLKDKDLRTFALETAYEVYTPPTVPVAAPKAPDDARVGKLEQQVAQMTSERQRAAYEQQRQHELAALTNSYPELRFQRIDDDAGLRVRAIIEQAQKESMLEKRVVPFAEVYTRMRRIEGGTPPPAAPATTVGAPAQPQAPRTRAESEAAMLTTLRRNGGLGGLQARLTASKR